MADTASSEADRGTLVDRTQRDEFGEVRWSSPTSILGESSSAAVPRCPAPQRPAVGYGLLAPAIVLVTAVLVFPVLFGMYESLFATTRSAPRFCRSRQLCGPHHRRRLLEFHSPVADLRCRVRCAWHSVGVALRFCPLSGDERAPISPGHVDRPMVAIEYRCCRPVSDAVQLRLWVAKPVSCLFGIDGPSWLGTPVLAMLVVILAQVWGDLPLSILVVLGGFLALDPNQMDAALVDGASGWQRFRLVSSSPGAAGGAECRPP